MLANVTERLSVRCNREDDAVFNTLRPLTSSAGRRPAVTWRFFYRLSVSLSVICLLEKAPWSLWHHIVIQFYVRCCCCLCVHCVAWQSYCVCMALNYTEPPSVAAHAKYTYDKHTTGNHPLRGSVHSLGRKFFETRVKPKTTACQYLGFSFCPEYIYCMPSLTEPSL